MAPTESPQRFEGMLYLQRLDTLKDAFPALKSFLDKLANEKEPGRKAVKLHYTDEYKRAPGRCRCLEFKANKVSEVEKDGFKDADALTAYLTENPAQKSREEMHKRLFILEDMEPSYVDALGHHLGVDPLVFSEQMNTWNFTDSWSIPHRGLPSMSIPGQAFTLRYYELRTLLDPDSVDVLTSQTSFAVNRRRYERWRDIDIPSLGQPDRRHAFVRRCASFWTSQKTLTNGKADGSGWDAVLLVDPPFKIAGTGQKPSETSANGLSTAETAETAETAKVQCEMVGGIELDDSDIAALEDSSILQAKGPFKSRSELWKAQNSKKPVPHEKKPHKSWPYHSGCSTLTPLMFSKLGLGLEENKYPRFQKKRNLTSAMDEMVFHWQELADLELIQETNEKSSNAAYYLLKHIAQHWVNQLELMNATIARGEWFSDDYQAKIDDNLSKLKWKTDLLKINEIAQDINYMRRHLNHFWRAMYLNLERLGIQLGDEHVDNEASLALQDAQRDFLTIHTRMQPLRDRAEALNSVSNDLSNLRAAFRGLSDGEFSLRLSLFASIVFPLTLLAGIFSMGDGFRPGGPHFWQLWAIGIPVCILVALGLVYGTQPWAVVPDAWNHAKLLFERWRKDEKAKQRAQGGKDAKQRTLEGSDTAGKGKPRERASRRSRDVEHGVSE